MTVAEREAAPCIGRSRAELMVAGCAILDAILDIWPAERVTVADRGVREGILLGLMGFALPITDGARWMRPLPTACEMTE
jgi:exopolyphosphatase/pppGpp-phosphohydrolase